MICLYIDVLNRSTVKPSGISETITEPYLINYWDALEMSGKLLNADESRQKSTPTQSTWRREEVRGK